MDANETEPSGSDYLATKEELRIIDEAIASIDEGQAATDTEVEAAFAKFIRREQQPLPSSSGAAAWPRLEG